MSTDAQKHIFISYSRHDGALYADAVERFLREHGYPIWRDTRNIDGHQDFTAELEEAIEQATHLVVCLTLDTKRSNSFVRREIGYALAINVPVIALRCEEILPHLSIINNTWIDYFSDPAGALQAVLGQLAQADENKPTALDEDPYRPYLQKLYRSIIAFLQRTVIREISLRSASTAGAVEEGPPPEADDVFSALLEAKARPYATSTPIDFAEFARAFEHFRRRVLVLGGPGAGKTTTLMVFARDAVAARLDALSEPLPLLGLITSFTGAHPDLATWIASQHADLRPEMVREAMQENKGLLLLDGLDEIREISARDGDISGGGGDHGPVDLRRAFIGLIPDNNQVVITSRAQDYAEIGSKLKLNGAVTLKPMHMTQIGQYLEAQPELLRLVGEDPQLQEVMSSPLILSMFAFAYRDLDPGQRQQFASLSSAAALRDLIFNRYIEKQYQRERVRQGGDLAIGLPNLLSDLEAIAMWNLRSDRAADNLFRVSQLIDQEVIADAPGLIRLAVALSLIVPVQEGNYRFIHGLMRDTLAHQGASKQLESQRPERQKDAISILVRLADVSDLDRMQRVVSAKETLRAHFVAEVLAHTEAFLARGLFEEGMALMNAARQMTEIDGDAAQRARLLLGLARFAARGRDPIKAADYASQLLTLMPNLPEAERDRLQALVDSSEGVLLAQSGEIDAARARFQTAYDAGQRLKDDLVIAIAGQNLAKVSPPDQGRAYLQRAIQSAMRVGNDYVVGNALMTLGAIMAGEDDLKQAGVYWKTALYHAQKVKDRLLEGRLQANLGEYYRLTGDFTQARAALEQGIRLGQQLDDPCMVGDNLLNLASVELTLKNPDAARTALARIKAEAADCDDPGLLESAAELEAEIAAEGAGEGE
jgi:tetratricopeptide (TPR) repeat protein